MAYLVVEDEEAERLAMEIAKATGQSISAVVTEALRERAERIPKGQEKASVEELLEIVDRIATYAKVPHFDHAAEFYDESGLPK